ncbi:MAG: TRAM domain-containing protein, partial [bacterium]|nr:TRAM domain-containing protein [bacterium]
MSPKQVELEIIDLAIDGKAVAHNDGKVVFIKGGLPGEIVLAEITRSKPRYDEAVLVEIVRKSEARRPAPCSHFDQCGGCTWQDLNYEDQLGFKKKQVEECMTRLGKFDPANVADVIGSVELFGYRNKM